MQIPTIESRVAVLEAISEQLTNRLDSMNTNMNNRFSNIENRLNDIDNRMNSNFKWLVGLLITVLLANIGTANSIIIALSRQ